MDGWALGNVEPTAENTHRFVEDEIEVLRLVPALELQTAERELAAHKAVVSELCFASVVSMDGMTPEMFQELVNEKLTANAGA